MSTESTKTNAQPSASPAGHASESPVSFLAQEYDQWQGLFQAQPALIQRFFEAQARSLADALVQPLSSARFTLPDRLVPAATSAAVPIPADQREQLVGGLMERLTRTGLNVALRQRLDELEASSQPAVAAAAGLVRFTVAITLVHDMLPSGRSVRYQPAEGDEIPTIPVEETPMTGSAITAASDAIAEEAEGTGEPDSAAQDNGRGKLLVPYVPAARRFFLPQWVAFDEQDRLLANTVGEAEAHLASMQRFVKILHTAVALAPYMVADEPYQHKRSGMLGQLINQGRALARYQTREIIATIQRRAAARDLNRGLSISLPYFDDQALEMKIHDFDVIPAGRVMFIPGFVVLAARKELAKVEQDTRLDRATRRHLLAELSMLEAAFLPADQNQ